MPYIVHTLSKPFNSVRHYSYQDICSRINVGNFFTDDGFRLFGSLSNSHKCDILIKHTDSQRVKLGNQKHNQCYARMCKWLQTQENGLFSVLILGTSLTSLHVQN